MGRKLFCEISPLTYRISTAKCITLRCIGDFFSGNRFSFARCADSLPVTVYRHKSLMRRRLGNVDMTLQENKTVNLNIAARCLDGLLIKPGETFSFWYAVGNPTAKKGYLEGLAIIKEHTDKSVGGGMCQMTNLIHWMALHSDLTITEHHHHDRYDLFPDYNRQVPFGVGTGVLYNYLDYRLTNNTDNTYQLRIHTDDEYLCGELCAERSLDHTYHILTEGERFVRENDGSVYRESKVYRRTVDARTGNTVATELIRSNHALVMYDTEGLTTEEA